MLTKAYSPPFEGGVVVTSRKSRVASLLGADGVVSFGCEQPPRLRELMGLREIFLIAQPPLLEKEGNISKLRGVTPS